MKDLESALAKFEAAAENQVKATESGDYKTGNKNYDIIIDLMNFLKEQNKINVLSTYFNHPSIGVRMWAAVYMLSIQEKEAKSVLKKIAEESGINATMARITLEEWQKGNLKL